MHSYQEKLSILSEMIAFAQVDEKLKPSEYNFLKGVANQLGITNETFEGLLTKKANIKILKTEGERLVQFYRLLLLMNIDKEVNLAEIGFLTELGIKMGLSPSAIERVVVVMQNYPNNLIPVEDFISIFKTQYN